MVCTVNKAGGRRRRAGAAHRRLEERFEAAFTLKARGASAREVEFGKIMLCNVLGALQVALTQGCLR